MTINITDKIKTNANVSYKKLKEVYELLQAAEGLTRKFISM